MKNKFLKYLFFCIASIFILQSCSPEESDTVDVTIKVYSNTKGAPIRVNLGG